MAVITLGEIVLDLIKASPYKQTEVADALHVTRQAITAWKSRNSFPQLYIDVLRDQFGIDITKINPREYVSQKEVSGQLVEDSTLSYTRKKKQTLSLIIEVDSSEPVTIPADFQERVMAILRAGKNT